MFRRPNRRQILWSVAALAALPAVALADLPATTTIEVPYPPGSAPDILARVLATKMGEHTGKTFVVENRPGANAIIGSTYAAKARNDGSVLLLVDRMTLVVNPLLYKSLPYDPGALVGISDVGRTNLFLTVRADAPYKTWQEFSAYAKANPEKVTIGTGGIGSVHHLSLELLGKAMGASFTHVPYKGVQPAVQDVMGGVSSGVISGAEVIIPQLTTGKLRVLAVGADSRNPLLPDVPTLAELGFKTPVLLPTTFTLFGPPGLSPALRDTLNAAARKAMADSGVAARLAPTGLVPSTSAPDDIRTALGQLRPQLTAVIRDANIHLD